MKQLFLFLLLIFLVSADFPIQTLVDCGISKSTIDGVQTVIDEHSSMIQLSKSNKRAQKTEIDSMKADIDFYLEENASESDKKKWMNCVTKTKPSSPEIQKNP